MVDKILVTYPGESERGNAFIIGKPTDSYGHGRLGNLVGFRSASGPTALPWFELHFEKGSVEFCGVPFAIVSSAKAKRL